MREQSKIGDIHVPVAVDVAEIAKQALGVAEGVVSALLQVAVAVEMLAVIVRYLGRERG